MGSWLRSLFRAILIHSCGLPAIADNMALCKWHIISKRFTIAEQYGTRQLQSRDNL